MADKAGYLTMYLAEGITLLSACSSFSAAENLTLDIQKNYGEDLANIINRTITFDNLANSSLPTTVALNL